MKKRSVLGTAGLVAGTVAVVLGWQYLDSKTSTPNPFSKSEPNSNTRILAPEGIDLNRPVSEVAKEIAIGTTPALNSTLSAASSKSDFPVLSVAGLQVSYEPFMRKNIPFELLQKLADTGLDSTQYALANDYFFGQNDAPKDQALALKWMRKAAENNYSHAFSGLMAILDKGEYSEKIVRKHIRWMEKQADKQNPHAQFGLGYMYYYGLAGAEENETLAFEWHRKAALNGSTEAQYELGAALFQGQYIAENKIEGRWWLEQAAAKGYEKASEKLNEIDGSHLDTPDENPEISEQTKRFIAITKAMRERAADDAPNLDPPNQPTIPSLKRNQDPPEWTTKVLEKQATKEE